MAVGFALTLVNKDIRPEGASSSSWFRSSSEICGPLTERAHAPGTNQYVRPAQIFDFEVPLFPSTLEAKDMNDLAYFRILCVKIYK